MLSYFDWERDAYGLYYKYNSVAADAINIQSEYAFSMTKEMYGEKEEDTSEFRAAITNYISGCHGVVNDCFDSSQINKILHRDLKSWIKKIACHPNQLTSNDMLSSQLTPEERCHLCILVMETKRRVELLHIARAIS